MDLMAVLPEAPVSEQGRLLDWGKGLDIGVRGTNHEDRTLASDVSVTNNLEQNQYEAHIDTTRVGRAEYQLTPNLIVFTHTEVDPAYEGRGVGSALARFALDDVRADGQREVLPLCPFIKAWIARHPEYAPLVFGQPSSKGRD